MPRSPSNSMENDPPASTRLPLERHVSGGLGICMHAMALVAITVEALAFTSPESARLRALVLMAVAISATGTILHLCRSRVAAWKPSPQLALLIRIACLGAAVCLFSSFVPTLASGASASRIVFVYGVIDALLLVGLLWVLKIARNGGLLWARPMTMDTDVEFDSSLVYSVSDDRELVKLEEEIKKDDENEIAHSDKGE